VDGLKTVAAAMDVQSERLGVLANNLANVGAVGFKADHLAFSQLLTSPRAAGPASPAGSAAPLSAPVTLGTRTDFSSGSLRETGNPLDLAIDGDGFFVVRTPQGFRLTRAGTFTRNQEGLLTALDGAPVMDRNREPIRLPPGGDVMVTESGEVRGAGGSVGQLLIARPADQKTLTHEGGTRFVPASDADLAPASGGVIRQGVLETSNVNAVLTLVEMIDALRVYEAAQRAARGVDETLGRAVNDVGRP
jgi:flagellar basal-body rod protein FlgF